MREPVIALDPDARTVESLRRLQPSVHEPGIEELLARAGPAIEFTSAPASLGACPLVVISRDVRTDDDGVGDVDAVTGLVDAVAPHLRAETVLVVMSQVPPGFTRRLAARLGVRHPEKRLRLFYWVETLVIGQAFQRFLRPARLILGCPHPAQELPEALGRGAALFDCPVLRMRLESAELTKAAINLYLACGVTYANTLSDLCERIGADWSEMLPALRLDPRIGPSAYIRPGLGLGGGNLERDLATLQYAARAAAVDASLIDAMIVHHRDRFRWVLKKLESEVFPHVQTPTIAVWGLAYKSGTPSMKHSPAVRAIACLGGRATIRAYDPLIPGGTPVAGATVMTSAEAAASGADCLVIMNDSDEFAAARPDAVARLMRRAVIIDCAGAMGSRPDALHGIRYLRMGEGHAAVDVS